MTSEDLKKLASEMWELDYEQSEATILKVLKKVRDETIEEIAKKLPGYEDVNNECCANLMNDLYVEIRALKEKKE